LGQFGFSYKLIARNTGFTRGQIYFRLNREKIQLKKYRDGKSKLSKLVIDGAEKFSSKSMKKYAAQQLKNQLNQIFD